MDFQCVTLNKNIILLLSVRWCCFYVIIQSFQYFIDFSNVIIFINVILNGNAQQGF